MDIDSRNDVTEVFEPQHCKRLALTFFLRSPRFPARNVSNMCGIIVVKTIASP